jgi:ubiquinone/menaquinone biosynthesis C-methylase UbiE
MWMTQQSQLPVAKQREPVADPGKQALDIYSDPAFAAALETWGEGTTWNEIQLLLASGRGKAIDIACGSGKVIELLSRFGQLDVHGCDISDFLVQKAVARGIAAERLTVCDATATPYASDSFDYGYSIGSLEHFTTEGIGDFVAECHRIVRLASYHQIPVSRSDQDEGWITPYQSYYNNSVAWWMSKFKHTYAEVHALDSAWADDRSVGKWFVCVKSRA